MISNYTQSVQTVIDCFYYSPSALRVWGETEWSAPILCLLIPYLYPLRPLYHTSSNNATKCAESVIFVQNP